MPLNIYTFPNCRQGVNFGTVAVLFSLVIFFHFQNEPFFVLPIPSVARLLV